MLGPPLGYVVFFWLLLPAAGDWSPASYHRMFDYHQVVLLPLAYMVGLLPALLTGLMDVVLTNRNFKKHVILCTIFGFAISFLPLLLPLGMGFLHGPYVLAFGLVGAIPGGVCSWLAGKWFSPVEP